MVVPTARPELSTVRTDVRSFEVTLVVPGRLIPIRFVVVLDEFSVRLKSSTRVFSPIVSSVTVPPPLAFITIRVVCVFKPRSAQLAGMVKPVVAEASV